MELDYSSYFWQGSKVRLRPVTPEDAEGSFAARLESPSRQLFQAGIDLPITLQGLRERLARFANCQEVDGLILFGIENLAGEAAGIITLHGMDPKNGVFSFGVLVDGPFRAKGYAEEAARILIRYCFHERRFQKCNSACMHTNQASIRLHQKLGFAEEGRRRRQVFTNGQFYDELLFGLTREEFEENDAR